MSGLESHITQTSSDLVDEITLRLARAQVRIAELQLRCEEGSDDLDPMERISTAEARLRAAKSELRRVGTAVNVKALSMRSPSERFLRFVSTALEPFGMVTPHRREDTVGVSFRVPKGQRVEAIDLHASVDELRIERSENMVARDIAVRAIKEVL